jgi:hypothetical protein
MFFRYFFLSILFIVTFVVAVAGFRGCTFTKPPIQIIPDMDQQPRGNPQGESHFFPDGREARMPVPGVTPRGSMTDDEYFDTGRMNDRWGNGIPMELDMEHMLRGQERYEIYCSVCHGSVGAGNGIVTHYGVVGVASFQSKRLQEMPDGQLYDVITNGKGLMQPYASKLLPQDRWAVVAYVRALQRSQNAATSDVPASQQAELNPYD